MCSTTSIAVPRTGQLPQGLANELGTFGVELCGRLVEDEMRGPHREERGDDDELRLAAGNAPRLALPEVLDAEDRHRRLGSLDRLAGRQPQVHGTEGDLLEDRAGHA